MAENVALAGCNGASREAVAHDTVPLPDPRRTDPVVPVRPARMRAPGPAAFSYYYVVLYAVISAMLVSALNYYVYQAFSVAMDVTPVGAAAARCAAQTTRMHDEVIAALAAQSTDVVTLRNELLLQRALFERAYTQTNAHAAIAVADKEGDL